ncbi:MAG: VOC family protein [Sulfitobacter sp.]
MTKTTPQTCRVKVMDHLVLTVRSIPDTVQFYTDILGMRAAQFDTADGETRWALAYGAHKINLHQQGNEFEPKAAHPTPGSADLCFLTDTPLETWIEHLKSRAINVEEGPVARTGAMGPLKSIYLRDPDHNLIEVSVQSDA